MRGEEFFLYAEPAFFWFRFSAGDFLVKNDKLKGEKCILLYIFLKCSWINKKLKKAWHRRSHVLFYHSCRETGRTKSRRLKTFWKKLLTKPWRCDNLLWLSQKGFAPYKKLLKKFLTSSKRYDKISELSFGSRTLITEQWNTWIENSFTFYS